MQISLVQYGSIKLVRLSLNTYFPYNGMKEKKNNKVEAMEEIIKVYSAVTIIS